MFKGNQPKRSYTFFFLFLSFYVDLLVMEKLIRATVFCALLNYECTGTNIS